jgi:hypothetical protein
METERFIFAVMIGALGGKISLDTRPLSVECGYNYVDLFVWNCVAGHNLYLRNRLGEQGRAVVSAQPGAPVIKPGLIGKQHLWRMGSALLIYYFGGHKSRGNTN